MAVNEQERNTPILFSYLIDLLYCGYTKLWLLTEQIQLRRGAFYFLFNY